MEQAQNCPSAMVVLEAGLGSAPGGRLPAHRRGFHLPRSGANPRSTVEATDEKHNLQAVFYRSGIPVKTQPAKASKGKVVKPSPTHYIKIGDLGCVFTCHLQFLKSDLIIIITLNRQSISNALGFLLSSNFVLRMHCCLCGLLLMCVGGRQHPLCAGTDGALSNFTLIGSI